VLVNAEIAYDVEQVTLKLNKFVPEQGNRI
jgi:hypothetical protein